MQAPWDPRVATAFAAAAGDLVASRTRAAEALHPEEGARVR